jgi:hypothetical protein
MFLADSRYPKSCKATRIASFNKARGKKRVVSHFFEKNSCTRINN